MTDIIPRQHPYPWRAMLAICSDLDETPDAATYFETSRFLNTSGDTSMGRGAGLEVGNTIYFKMPDDQFSYCNASDRDRKKIHDLVKSGHIDCLHSFGDFVSTREEIESIWKLLKYNECAIEVWIDHGVARSNFDADIMYGEGAAIGAPCYHADLTLNNGIKYIWKGRVTSIVAQNANRSYKGIFDSAHPLASMKTIGKEFAKALLAVAGSRKYAMHGENRVITYTGLPSGQPIVEFMRTNPSWGGVSHFETADGIGEVLTNKTLDQLVDASGTSIFYTHLGKSTGGEAPLPPSAVEAFYRLSDYQRHGRILVTTTRRLLGYCDAVQSSQWRSRQHQRQLTIELRTTLPRRDLDGLTWYVPRDVDETHVEVNGSCLVALQMNPPDHTGQPSASIPFQRLVYPAGVTP
jgi:hypothetical protein